MEELSVPNNFKKENITLVKPVLEHVDYLPEGVTFQDLDAALNDRPILATKENLRNIFGDLANLTEDEVMDYLEQEKSGGHVFDFSAPHSFTQSPTLVTEAKQNYYISNRDQSFETVNGIKLTNDLFAYKRDSNYSKWVITDIASGTAIMSKLDSLKACKEYVTNLTTETLELIAVKKTLPAYTDQCQRLDNYKLKLTGGLDFTEAIVELDNLSEKADQLSLFDL